MFESRQNKGNKDLFYGKYMCIDGDLQYSGNISAISWYGKKTRGKNHKQTEKNMNK